MFTPGIPTNQVNAHLSRDLTMRIGIPHRGGRLAFHAFERGYPAMVSASAFWNPKAGAFSIPECTNLTEVDFALDSAGFTAMRLWKQKGRQPGMAGVFPWTYAQYIELAALMRPAWWSQPDLCCEPEIATSEAEIDYRIRATATLLEGSLRIVYAWQNELAKECSPGTVANMLQPPVPVLQGWKPEHYRRSLDLMLQVWQRWEPWIASPALIGVGSVCRRPVAHREHGLLAVLAGLEHDLPQGSRLHLFGVKGAALERVRMLPWVASADSMAYDSAARWDACKSGASNTMERRCGAMTEWMHSAGRQLAAKSGDQHRLDFAGVST
jgi:hypothetical protein